MDETQRPPDSGGAAEEASEPTTEQPAQPPPASGAPESAQPPSERPTPPRPAPAAGEGPTAPRPAPAAGERPVPPRPAPPGAAAGAPRPAGAAPARPAPAAPATPAAPKEPEPDPEEVVALRKLAPDLTWQRVHGYVEVTLPVERLLEAARLLRDELGYDYLSSITAVDWRDHFELVYHLYSFDYRKRPGCVVLFVELPHDDYPLAPSLTRLWPGAEFQEREVYDLMGIKFVGHPDLSRILLDDDFPGHPLRKDFTFDYEYVLMRHLRSGADRAPEPAEPAERGARDHGDGEH